MPDLPCTSVRHAEEAVLAYARVTSKRIPIPLYCGFHVRPSTYIAKIVHRYGAKVQVYVGNEVYDAGCVFDLFRANEEINMEKRRGIAKKLLRDHEGGITTVAVSLDSHWLVTGSQDGIARLWNLHLDELMKLACQTADRNLSYTEWNQYFWEEEYRLTCAELSIHPSVLTTARNFAQSGDIAGAIVIFQRAVKLDSNLEFDPKMEAKKWTARGLVAKGQQLAQEGKVEEAIAAYEEAKTLDPSLTLDPQTEAARGLVAKGQQLAQEGKVEEAIAAYKEAKTLDPSLTLDPQTEVDKWAAKGQQFIPGSRIALQADTGKWFTRCHICQNVVGNELSDTITVHIDQPSPAYPFARFVVIDVGNGKIALKADTGKYVARCRNCIVNGTKNDFLTVHVTDPSAAPYAQFTLEPLDNGKYALQADTGKYVARCRNCSPGAKVPDTVTIHVDDPTNAPYAQWKIIEIQ